MVKEKECARKCSHCGNNGHNSRTCNGKGCLKLFGVEIAKSSSTGNLESCHNAQQHSRDDGYLSDGLIQFHERKKGVPWTEEEHGTFLVGLKKLGKGDWKGISNNFVPTRTPTQVASHAQKYFLRKSTSQNKKRRSSLFDMSFKEPATPSQASPVSPLSKIAEIQPKGKVSSEVHDFSTTTKNVKNVHYCVPPTKMIPTVIPVVSVMNFPRPGYVYLPRNHVNFATCAPVTFLSSGISAPQSLPLGSSNRGPLISATEEDGLELKIAQPQNPQGAELSSHIPGAIGVI